MREHGSNAFALVTGRGGRRSPTTERILLAIACVIFIGVAVAAARQMPQLDQQPDLRWAGVVALLAGVGILINSREFAWSARVLGVHVDWARALRVSTLSSAANVLPIPGSVAMRTRALLQGGQPMRVAVAVTTAIGVAWVGVAALAAGILASGVGHPRLAVVATGGGAIAVAGAVWMIRRAAPLADVSKLLRLLVIEVGSIAASSLRLLAVSETLGFGVTADQAVTINLGGILSNAAGILPGGLGVRELLSGAFGAMVGLATSLGVLMAAADRVASYLVLAVIALMLSRGQVARTADRGPGADHLRASSERES